MGDQYMGYSVDFHPRHKVPKGYSVEGVVGDGFDGKPVRFYYWWHRENGEDRFGDDVKTRWLALRGAKADAATRPAPAAEGTE